MSDQLAKYLGLCRRAGKAACGTEAVRTAARQGKAKLVLLAGDASDNTDKRINNLCAYYQVPLARLSQSCIRLGEMVGMGGTAALAICDDSFAGCVTACLEQPGEIPADSEQR